MPAGEVAEHTGFGRGGALGHPPAHLGIRQGSDPLRNRQAQHRPPSGQAVDDRPGEEREPDAHPVGQGQRHHPPPVVGGVAGRVQLAAPAFGIKRGDGEHVPVGGAAGGRRHGRHELDLVLIEAVQAAGQDQLQRRPVVFGDGGRQCQQLTAVGRPRRHRRPAAVVVSVGLRGGKAQRAGLVWPGAAGRPWHRWRSGRPLSRRWPHLPWPPGAAPNARPGNRRSPRCGPPASRASRRSPSSPRTGPVPGRERHALDPGHQPHQIVGVLRARGRQAETAVSAETVVTPCRLDGLAVGSQASWAS